MKKVFKKLGVIACWIVILTVFMASGWYLVTALKGKDPLKTISASAEESIESVQSMYSDYSPVSNLMCEDFSLGMIDRVTGSLIQGDALCVKVFVRIQPDTVYTITSAFTSELYFYDSSQIYIGYVGIGECLTFRTPSNCFYYRYRLSSNYGTVYNNNVMLNVGSTAYPYIPSLDSAYQSGYDEGVSDSLLGYLSNCYAWYKLKYNSATSYETKWYEFPMKDHSPEYGVFHTLLTDCGCYEELFVKIPADLEDTVPSAYLSRAEVTYYFTAFSYLDESLYCDIHPNIVTCELLVNGYWVDGYIDRPVGSTYGRFVILPSILPTLGNNVMVSGVRVDYMTEIEAFVTSSLVSKLGSFSLGYDKGYSSGYEVGSGLSYKNGYIKGKNDGYTEGYTSGQADAFNKIADSGDLANGVKTFVYSLFDAPVSTFTSVFNFEIDGIDIGAIVVFILTMSLVTWLVRLFV